MATDGSPVFESSIWMSQVDDGYTKAAALPELMSTNRPTIRMPPLVREQVEPALSFSHLAGLTSSGISPVRSVAFSRSRSSLSGFSLGVFHRSRWNLRFESDYPSLTHR